MKLFVLGHARHGKDTVAEYIEQAFGLTFRSSSHIAAETVVMPYLAERGITYPDVETAYADRVNHRAHWFDAIAAYNAECPTRLAQEIFRQYDIYVGIRNRAEFIHAKELADLSIWVDAFDRCPPESTASNTILRTDADVIIDNSGSLDDLYNHIEGLFKALMVEFY